MTFPSSVAVFCGSKFGDDPKHEASARALGEGLAERDTRLVYGGGGIGLMGAVATAALDKGGEVKGVIPEFLLKFEVGDLPGVDQEITDSMHSRKKRMFELSDAFVAISGGLGTMDELIEITTWKQLRLHDKPIILLNEDGYWDDFVQLFDSVIAGGFASPESAELITIVDSVEKVFDVLSDVSVSKTETASELL
jgi:uncharacterized protein (TIGR00730 family)